MLLQIARGVALAAIPLGVSGLVAGSAGIAWALLAMVGIYLLAAAVIEFFRWRRPQPAPLLED